MKLSKTRFRGGWIWLERARRWNFKKKKNPQNKKRRGLLDLPANCVRRKYNSHSDFSSFIYKQRDDRLFLSLLVCWKNLFVHSLLSVGFLSTTKNPPPIVMEKKKNPSDTDSLFLRVRYLTNGKWGGLSPILFCCCSKNSCPETPEIIKICKYRVSPSIYVHDVWDIKYYSKKKKKRFLVPGPRQRMFSLKKNYRGKNSQCIIWAHLHMGWIKKSRREWIIRQQLRGE